MEPPLWMTMRASAVHPACGAVCAVRRAVSFKADVNGGLYGDAAGGGTHKKPHTSIVIDRNATMSGNCKRSAKDTITVKVGSWRCCPRAATS